MSKSHQLTVQTPEDIRSWLFQRVSYYIEEPVEKIDPEVSLARYGLDSLYTFALCGDIEDTLGVPIEPTLVWDIDTLNALVTHLVGLVGARTENPLP